MLRCSTEEQKRGGWPTGCLPTESQPKLVVDFIERWVGWFANSNFLGWTHKKTFKRVLSRSRPKMEETLSCMVLLHRCDTIWVGDLRLDTSSLQTQPVHQGPTLVEYGQRYRASDSAVTMRESLILYRSYMPKSSQLECSSSSRSRRND